MYKTKLFVAPGDILEVVGKGRVQVVEVHGKCVLEVLDLDDVDRKGACRRVLVEFRNEGRE